MKTLEQYQARAKEIERNLEWDENGDCSKYTYEVIAGAMLEAAKEQAEEDGRKVVLREMRGLILKQCGEWLKWNAQPKYIYIEDGQPWIDNARLIHDFEAAMKELWKED